MTYAQTRNINSIQVKIENWYGKNQEGNLHGTTGENPMIEHFQMTKITENDRNIRLQAKAKDFN